MKNSLDKLNSIFKSTEERVSEYEDRSREIIQSEKTERKNE